MCKTIKNITCILGHVQDLLKGDLPLRLQFSEWLRVHNEHVYSYSLMRQLSPEMDFLICLTSMFELKNNLNTGKISHHKKT